jgi:hypothetical protein
MIAEAIALATEVHGKQFDKQGAPYILHPLRVMFAVRDAGHPEPHQVVAVLHDALEDAETESDRIRVRVRIGELFNPRIGLAIIAMTHDRNVPYMEYIKDVKNDPIAAIVKRFDIEDNMDPKRFFHKVNYKKYAKALGFLLGQ